MTLEQIVENEITSGVALNDGLAVKTFRANKLISWTGVKRVRVESYK